MHPQDIVVRIRLIKYIVKGVEEDVVNLLKSVKNGEPAMYWENYTVFKDPVLEYIGVPKAIVSSLVDKELFQRLHDIAQTGMEILYPGATHNRFCHSIGVYHLGRKAYNCFQQNIKSQYRAVYYKVAKTPAECNWVWNRWGFIFELACLLHDCGHPN